MSRDKANVIFTGGEIILNSDCIYMNVPTAQNEFFNLWLFPFNTNKYTVSAIAIPLNGFEVVVEWRKRVVI